jgi:response regulator RpfG family c-di-GMP phosphodiesterase
MGLDESELKDIVYAAALHNIGAVSLSERMDPVHFEYGKEKGHAEKGYQLLNT